MHKLRWGFLSTAAIGRKNWTAIRHTPNCALVAVASREIARSRRFIGECQSAEPLERPPAAFGSYEELIASPEVDAVYVPLPTGLRKAWVVRAAEARKHILCEKPCAVDADELEEMLAACRANRVQFMDGVTFMHSPRLRRIRAALDDPAAIGEIRRIMSMYSFASGGTFFQKNIRIQSELEPAGALGDLGWYCIRFALWAMNWQMPLSVAGKILSAHDPRGGSSTVPVEFSGELVFPGAVSAGFFCSFLSPNQEWVNVSGTKGWLRVDDFALSKNADQPSFQLNEAVVKTENREHSSLNGEKRAMTQLSVMFRHFADQVRSGTLNDEWPEWALKTQRIVDACLESARLSSRPLPLKAVL